jgi:hypothetical protein
MVTEANATEEYPLGITIESIEAFKNEQKSVKVHNCPVRDVDNQDVWDFMNEGIPGDESVFTPEMVKTFREVLA